MNNFTPVLLIILSATLFYGYIDPTYADIRRLQSTQEEYVAAVESAKKVEEIRDSLVAKYNSFASEDLSRLEKMVPENIDHIRLVAEIDALGQEYGISIRSVQITEERGVVPEEGSIVSAPTAEERSLRLSFVFDTDYASFVKFMADIEKNLRIIDPASISFAVAGNTANKNTYTVSFNTYWLP